MRTGLDADALLVYHEVSITGELIAAMDHCRVIVRCGAGYDNIDLAAAANKGIVVSNTPDYGVDEVADHAIALMLACNRRLLVAERRLRFADPLAPWDRGAVEPVHRLAGSTFGVIGCGRIGAATALRAKALKMRVLVHDPYFPSGMDKVLGISRVDLQTLLVQSDVVSLHTPLTGETRHLINAQTLSAMKATAYLINTARGAVVDIHALASALRERRLAGAGIDVLPEEPPTPDNPLIQLWRETGPDPVNLVITPHTAYYSGASLIEIRTKASAEAARVLRGERPQNQVNS
jgi:lactate dehydrogenase-like 2-hydroxyacid dehydrogenase